MCGRFCLFDELKEIEDAFGIDTNPHFNEGYNITPGQDITCIDLAEDANKPQFNNLMWGITPVWAKTPSQMIINARAESVATKPTFKALQATKHCAVVASGYYEWREAEQGGKQPYFIYTPDQHPFAMAALWAYGLSKDNKKIKRCVILTQEATKDMQAIHHRMPVIMQPHNINHWVNSQTYGEKEMTEILKASFKDLAYYPVSDAVNNPKNNDPRCIEPLV
jgi:putative SOS response-associated peptidase YedK